MRETVEETVPEGAHYLRLLRTVVSGMVDLVLPPQCASCGAPTAGGRGLCVGCWSHLDLIDAPLCPRTGLPFVYDAGEGVLSAVALARSSPIERVRGAARFDVVARDLVHKLKYKDRHEASDTMARLMLRAGGEVLRQADLLVPVPLHRRRLWQRRYNQSAILAHRLVQLQGAGTVDPMALVRVRSTRAQVGLGLKERRRNVKDAFQVSRQSRQKIDGRRVLLIDDVWTSGATAEACASALLESGATAVDALVFALVCSPVAPGE